MGTPKPGSWIKNARVSVEDMTEDQFAFMFFGKSMSKTNDAKARTMAEMATPIQEQPTVNGSTLIVDDRKFVPKPFILRPHLTSKPFARLLEGIRLDQLPIKGNK